MRVCAALGDFQVTQVFVAKMLERHIASTDGARPMLRTLKNEGTLTMFEVFVVLCN